MSDERPDTRNIPAGSKIVTRAGSGNWPLRALEWPAPKGQMRGSLLFLNGRADFLEKYLESYAHWHRMGWHITAFDWRGQGGSGRLAPDKRVGHAQSFAPWINDLATIFERIKQDQAGPHVIIAHSMGGHLLLRALQEERIFPDSVVFLAPMFGVNRGPLPLGLAHWFADWMCRRGPPERAAWKENERPFAGKISRQANLTHDDLRYEDETWWRTAHPELDLGPPSWAWLAEAFRSTRVAAQDGEIERVTTPALIIGTDGDNLVDSRAIRTIAPRFPNGELKMFDRAVAHEVLRERDEVRNLALLAIDKHLDRTAPATS